MMTGEAGHGFAVGVDIGGTFTDCVVLDSAGRTTAAKVPTTPEDRSAGFFGSIERAAAALGLGAEDLLSRCDRLVHGTTTGTNALVARSGATVGLLTTAGHSDAMRIMKGSGRTIGLPSDQTLDVPNTHKPEPLVDTRLIAPVRERIDVDGDVVVPLDEGDVRRAIALLLERGAEAIAISFLWSIVNPRHERRAAEIVDEVAPGRFVSCSSDISSAVGEYERTAVAVANAYIGPLMERYVSAIESGARARGYKGPVLFTQCAGGAVMGEEASSAPAKTIHSGPVAGVVASVMLAKRLGTGDVIAADMGGTTLDVSVIHGGTPVQRNVSLFERFSLALPMLDVESIGAGGGSIAWVDDAGRLSVGPESAGADPGPACYGRGGTEPTVTDADVVLGIIDPARFLDGRMRLDRREAELAIAPLAERLGMTLVETAAGINRVVDAKMADLVRRVSLLRGFDPRKFDCFAFGGGGPVHMTAVATDSGISRVIVPLPRLASVWSALGAAGSDVSHVLQEWKVIDLPVAGEVVDEVFGSLESRARELLAAEGFEPDRVELTRSARMRYAMQVHDVEVPVRSGKLTDSSVDEIDTDFERIHEALFGRDSGYRQGGVQFTGFQVRAVGTTPKPALIPEHTEGEGERTTRPVYWYELGEEIETPVWSLTAARRESDLLGPVLIELPDSVIVVRPGQSGSWDELGNFVIATARMHVEAERLETAVAGPG
jgi:N-methylhydantoinase A